MSSNTPAEIIELLNDTIITVEVARRLLDRQGFSQGEIDKLLEGHTGLTEAQAEELEA